MINVKGTKSVSPETDASQRYVLKSGDEVSRTPLVIGGLLTGVAAYLASIFSWGREQIPPSQPEEPPAAAADAGTPAGMVEESAIPRESPDLPDSESPGSVTPIAAAMALRYPNESEGVPVSGSARANGGAERADRGGGASPATAEIFDLAGNRLSPGGGGPSVGKSPPGDNPPAGGNGPVDGSGATNGDGSTKGDGSADGDGSTNGDGSANGDDSADSDTLDPEDDDDVGTRPDGNRAPRVSGPVYLLDVAPCVALLIALDDLLSKAEDPDGDVLSVQNLAVSSGTLTEAEGGWVFQSDDGQPGPVTVTYQVTDGELVTDAVARFSVVEQPVITGTAANDTLLGSMCADEIDGAGGDDNIDGRAGNDVLIGGSGDDHIVAGDGDDVVVGGDGEDIIFGGAGNDHLFGGAGDDRLFGGFGDDVIFGNTGEDHLSGGEGDDLLLGGDGADSVHGDGGDDTLTGGAGDDKLYDGAGRDQVFGGMGSDRVVAALDADDDVYDGGGGNSDTLDYSHATKGLVVNLVSGVVSGVEIGDDSITGFEKVLGGREADHFILGGEAATLAGGAGDDVFAFASAGGGLSLAVSHVILDFGVGDRIRMSEYDIFWKDDDEPDDRFEHIYHGEDDDDLPIRYRHDRDDGSEWTVVETDFEDDEMWATAVSLQGVHKLSWSTQRDDGLEWLS
ncbi:calcium-binding protein [Halomonas huangheensis]|uniref:Cadherin-like domain-containing protein n=1 Tax=Halomonas huangheensis TaxID=1178482 RepID=W1ND88_9GAMM|nr:cadherin-like domain-containing protein [Halomonas huangheensis]ALM52970.1 hypothetical protein AR456_12240 [Halomonas huangheensis]ERL53105.1 hypothetical protein BJB45_17675 [Halomonas huangheensis]